MCLVMALMRASGVSTSHGCLGCFPRLGLSPPYHPPAAGKSLGLSGLADGVRLRSSAGCCTPPCCKRLPKVPRVLAALQPPLPPPISQPRQCNCATGIPPRHMAKKYQFSINMAGQFPGETGNSLCPAPNPSLVLTHPAGAHLCSHRSPTCHLQAESLQMSITLSPHHDSSPCHSSPTFPQ